MKIKSMYCDFFFFIVNKFKLTNLGEKMKP